MITQDDILTFWLDTVGPKGWYGSGQELDAEIRSRFKEIWLDAMDGACGLWLTSAPGTLAYIILTDQLPRNMFRDQAQAFASDAQARAASKIAINREWDMRISEPARSFFYLPLVHSESLVDQDRAVRLIHDRMPETGAGNLLHAAAHREVIRRFGRFPFRNAALGRDSTQVETDFLLGGGYGAIVRELERDAKQVAQS